MDTAQILVTVSGAVLIAAVLLFFFGPGAQRQAVDGSRPVIRRRRCQLPAAQLTATAYSR